MRESKPESIDEDLRDRVTAAYGLNELKTAGARFEYPDGLETWEWASLTALHRGKAKADAKERKKPKR